MAVGFHAREKRHLEWMRGRSLSVPRACAFPGLIAGWSRAWPGAGSPVGALTRWVQPATLRCMVAKVRDTAISQLRRGVLEFCVLALLRDGERYSYELVRALGSADGLVTTEGTLYPLLARLRREGTVDTTWRESSSGPPRRYYRLTADGHTALSGFVSDWARFRDSVDALLGHGALR